MQEACQCLVIPVTVCAHLAAKAARCYRAEWALESRADAWEPALHDADEGSGITRKCSCQTYL